MPQLADGPFGVERLEQIVGVATNESSDGGMFSSMPLEIVGECLHLLLLDLERRELPSLAHLQVEDALPFGPDGARR